MSRTVVDHLEVDAARPLKAQMGVTSLDRLAIDKHPEMMKARHELTRQSN